MIYDAILFDLDGTLLPIDTDEFTKKYVERLVTYLSKYDYEPQTFVKAMWQGVMTMSKNDGSKRNFDIFYDVLNSIYGQKVYDDMDIIINFYKNEFNESKQYVNSTNYAKELVSLAHQKAKYVILATNPFFPKEALETKLSWLGLSVNDFDFITHYENSYYSKPNPHYYKTIVNELHLNPKNCLMIGNDVEEDIIASNDFNHFLITNYILNRKNLEITCPSGTYEECVAFLKKIKTVKSENT